MVFLASNGYRCIAHVPAGNDPGQANGNGAPGNDQPGNGSAATNKQAKLILDLGRTRKISLSAVEAFCRETTGSADDVYGLTESQASAVIDRFKADGGQERPRDCGQPEGPQSAGTAAWWHLANHAELHVTQPPHRRLGGPERSRRNAP